VPLRSVLLVLLWLRLCRAGHFVSSCENTCGIMYRRIQSTTLHSTPITAGSTAYSVIPAKAGIQANWNGERTWIPACAGMTRCGENGQREPPFSSSLGERKIMKHFVVNTIFVFLAATLRFSESPPRTCTLFNRWQYAIRARDRRPATVKSIERARILALIEIQLLSVIRDRHSRH